MSNRTEDIIIPVEHGEPCYTGVSQRKPGKIWNVYFLTDSGKSRQWIDLEFKKVGDAVKYSMSMNYANGNRQNKP